MLCFLSIAARRGFRINRYVDSAIGEMGKNTNGKVVLTTVRLRPRVEWDPATPSKSIIAEIHDAAHEVCFIANSVLTDVLIEHEA